MESSQILGFLQILSQSIKLVLRNAILIASTTTLSILLTSILFLLFSFANQTATNYMINSTTDSRSSSSGVFFLQAIIFFALSIVVDLTFMLSYITVAHALAFATVTATAASYTDGSKLSLPDVFSSVRAKWRSPFRFRKNNRGSTGWRSPMHFLSFVAMAVAVPVVMFYPNPITIAVASVAGVSIFIFYLYALVVSELAAVVLVVEDGCEAAEVVEKAEKLVEGMRVQGFMVNVFTTVVNLIVLVSFWMIVGDVGSLSQNINVYSLFFVNCVSVTRIFVGVAYTVFYFRCKEYHGDKKQLPGDFNYTALVNDIP